MTNSRWNLEKSLPKVAIAQRSIQPKLKLPDLARRRIFKVIQK